MPYGSRKFGAAKVGFRGNMAGARCPITAPKFSNFFSFSKLLFVVLGPVNVDKLFSVENVPSATLRSAPAFR